VVVGLHCPVGVKIRCDYSIQAALPGRAPLHASFYDLGGSTGDGDADTFSHSVDFMKGSEFCRNISLLALEPSLGKIYFIRNLF